MKKNLLKIFSLLILTALISPMFSACSEDTSCKLIVVVKDVEDSDQRIPGVTIDISKESGSVKRTGYTNSDGEASFSFDNEAILDINISLTDPITQYTRVGKSTVRLIQGETVTREVLLQN